MSPFNIVYESCQEMADCVLLSDQITNWWFAAHYNNVEILILNFMFYKDTFLQQFYQWKKFRHFSVNCVIIHEYLGGGSHRITISHSSVYILHTAATADLSKYCGPRHFS